MMSNVLQQQQILVAQNKSYWSMHRINYTGVLIMIVFVPCLWIGWKMSKEKWLHRVTNQLVELITLTFFTYFRKELINLFNKHGS